MVTAQEKALLCELSAHGPLLEALLSAEKRAEADAADKARAVAHYTAMAAEAISTARKPGKPAKVPKLQPPANHVMAASYGGATFTVAVDPDDGEALYAVLLNGVWMMSHDALSEYAIAGLQADIDTPEEPEFFAPIRD